MLLKIFDFDMNYVHKLKEKCFKGVLPEDDKKTLTGI